MIKVGFGYDLHKLTRKNGNPDIKLFSIHVDSEYKIIAHSDGDVGIHALADAILGAIGEEDIGTFFPKKSTPINYDSINILNLALKKLTKLKYKINNIDLIIVSDQIIFNKYKSIFKQALIKITNVNKACISIKAKTTENTNPLTLSCYAIVLISN